MSRESGIADAAGKAFGVVATDVNNDGLMDLFVGNDTVANFLFLNKGKGTLAKRSVSGRALRTAKRAARVPVWEWMPLTTTETDGRTSS